jgi:hypothetical protein
MANPETVNLVKLSRGTGGAAQDYGVVIWGIPAEYPLYDRRSYGDRPADETGVMIPYHSIIVYYSDTNRASIFRSPLWNIDPKHPEYQKYFDYHTNVNKDVREEFECEIGQKLDWY